ncbi:alpha/beta hydrolase [Metabacillus indicus]|uniref:alpha/beta hydrolase n=1 Tax=Metabacillus indicus TaxID=246786 RepID=UPI003CEF768D
MNKTFPIDKDLSDLLNRISERMTELKHPLLMDLTAEQSRFYYSEARKFFMTYLSDRINIIDAAAGKDRIPVRIYQPAGKSDMPVLLFMHGGGWVFGDLDSADSLCTYIAEHAECLVISAGYRLAPEHPFPAALLDVMQVACWATRNVSKWNGRPDQMAIGGESSGANLAAAATLWMKKLGRSPFHLQVLITPVLNRNFETESYLSGYSYNLTKEKMEWFWSHYLKDERYGDHPFASPLLADSFKDLPAALLVTAEYDPLRDEGFQYAERLIKDGVPVTHLHFSQLVHSFPNMLGQVKKADDAMMETAENLKKMLRERLLFLTENENYYHEKKGDYLC